MACSVCSGKGECPRCRGAGKVWDMGGLIGLACPLCKGDKVCPKCRGKG